MINKAYFGEIERSGQETKKATLVFRYCYNPFLINTTHTRFKKYDKMFLYNLATFFNLVFSVSQTTFFFSKMRII